MRAHDSFAAALLLGAVATVAACARAPDLAARLRGPTVAAHRGGHGLPDANTVARFEAARRLGADVVETDLRVSRDGVVFLFHDERLDRATSCRGPLASRTAAELERCPLRGVGRGPDRFEDALRWSRGRVVIDAELKSFAAVEPAIDLVRRYAAYDWVYFQVGHGLDVYERVRAYDRRVALEAAPKGADARLWLDKLLAKRDPRLLIIQLQPELVTDEIQRAVAEGNKLTSINAWRLAPERETASCALAFARKIDIAVTDAPESCVAQREAARAE